MSATCVSHSASPVLASMATSAASSVPTNSRWPSTATPRLKGLISCGLFASAPACVSPDLAPRSCVEATTTPGSVVYITPSTTNGVACKTESPGMASVHAACSRFTLPVSICFNAE